MKLAARSLLLLTALILPACTSEEPPPTGPSELVVEELTVGTGATAAAGDLVTVHYVGSFLDGRVFDSSIQRGTPYTFRLGTGAVITGFDQGVTGMRVGGRRRLTIPPNLAYGAQGSGAIPPNTTLRFEIDLLFVTR